MEHCGYVDHNNYLLIRHCSASFFHKSKPPMKIADKALFTPGIELFVFSLQSISAVVTACREIRGSRKFGKVLEVRPAI